MNNQIYKPECKKCVLTCFFRMSNIRLGVASVTDMSLGRAVLVEDCSCPAGYSGTSCEVRMK